jgi:hypothetical protein
MPGEPLTKIPPAGSPVLDLSEFTSKERELLFQFATLLREGRSKKESREEVLRLWRAYSALPPIIPNEDEADRIALEAVAYARGRV